MKRRLPLTHAFLWVILSLIAVSGTACLVWLYFLHINVQRQNDSKFNIVAIVQSTTHPEMMETDMLAEILGLTADQPENLYKFSTRVAERKLLTHPLIKSAHVKKIKPGTLYIDYTLRLPVAFVGDYTNTAIDDEGVLIPFSPYFTPKKLPFIYLGGKDVAGWGEKIRGESAMLALELLKKFSKSSEIEIKNIDVSRAFAPSFGQREVVVILVEEDERFNANGDRELIKWPRILRLSTDQLHKALINYAALAKYLNEHPPSLEGAPLMVDLRIAEIATIK